MTGPLRVGIIGVGTISRQYLDAFPRLPNLQLAAVADLDADRAAVVAVDAHRPGGARPGHEISRVVTHPQHYSGHHVGTRKGT